MSTPSAGALGVGDGEGEGEAAPVGEDVAALLAVGVAWADELEPQAVARARTMTTNDVNLTSR
jgi:hypothetical protein